MALRDCTQFSGGAFGEYANVIRRDDGGSFVASHGEIEARTTSPSYDSASLYNLKGAGVKVSSLEWALP